MASVIRFPILLSSVLDRISSELFTPRTAPVKGFHSKNNLQKPQRCPCSLPSPLNQLPPRQTNSNHPGTPVIHPVPQSMKPKTVRVSRSQAH